MKLLPHRDDMLLLDEVSLDGGGRGTLPRKRRRVLSARTFSGNPIVPELFFGLGTVGLCAYGGKLTEGALPVYTGLNNVKIPSPVKPGDTVETRCSVKRAKHPFYFSKAVSVLTVKSALQRVLIRDHRARAEQLNGKEQTMFSKIL